mmetsp:Transcript_19609/g.25846  ORF Transcript_19609/g.25846 Transcript_19609/m.25846 type:complete len:447 (+) Transcript_19609:104-1444(+)
MCKDGLFKDKSDNVPSGTKMKKYTLTELRESLDLVAIEGKVYNIAEFANVHPGGEEIRFFGGHEATSAYYSLHLTHSKPSKVLGKYLVGTIEEKSAEGSYDMHSPFAKEVRKAVQDKLMELPNKWWAPSWVHWRTFLILTCTFSFDFSWCYYGPTLLKTFLLAFCMALVGLNIQHDANHGAFSKKPWINKVLGYTQDYIGGSRMLWIRQHVVGHHPNTSHEEFDPDVISGLPIMILHSKFFTERKWFHALQHVYVWILLCFLALSWVFMDIQSAWNMQLGGWASVNKRMNKEKYFSIFGKMAFILRFLGMGWYHTNSLPLTLGHFILLTALGGGYLGFFFILSHNFDDAVHATTQETDCWYKIQAESSSNVGGFPLLVLNGGLNYQIEHHLFPRVSSAHYHYIAPTVKAVCEKHGVQYTHFPTVGENFKSTCNFLRNMGTGRVKAE